jgi:uncharacterized membrane protein YeaQ/YmgE (transglycosylase-associated protein family)
MDWTLTNLAIQVVAGVLGGHAAAAAMKEHSFGLIGHTIAGAVGGTLSGYFLQTLVVTVVTGADGVNQPGVAENAILQILAGAAAGAILMVAVGIGKHSVEQHKRV